VGLEPTRRCMALVGTLSKVVLGGRLGLSAVDRRNRAGVFFRTFTVSDRRGRVLHGRSNMLTTLYTVHQPVCRRGIGPHVHRGLSDRSMGFLFRLSFCTFGESGGHSVLPEARRRWW